MAVFEQLLDKIKSKNFTAGVIGLGYVGLPLAHSMCRKGIKVVGFDIDPKKADMLNAGKSYLETVRPEWFAAYRKSGLFEATADMARLREADVIVICVPTPLDEHREPDLSYVAATARSIAAALRSGQLVILESTSWPGTLREVVKPILEETGLKSGFDFFAAFSPEREDPGNKNFETSTIPKVVGGDGEQASTLANTFYSLFIDKTVPVATPEVAEAVKITENIFRAVNIALVNELKVIYDRMGIDIWDVIEAAKTKPFGYMPFYPGPGLGGHCIPIDPFYLTWKAREFEVPTRFIELAGEININMPRYVLDKTAAALDEHAGKGLKGAKILIVGIAYKKNINDQRESPAFPLIKMLHQRGAVVEYHDPHIPEITPMRHFPEMTGKKSTVLDEKTISSYDAAIIVTDHDNIDFDCIARHARLLIDTRNALRDSASRKNIVKA